MKRATGALSMHSWQRGLRTGKHVATASRGSGFPTGSISDLYFDVGEDTKRPLNRLRIVTIDGCLMRVDEHILRLIYVF